MNTKELGHFVTTIPELRERMKKLEAHTNIAFALLEQIKARQLDNFYLLEEVSLRYVSSSVLLPSFLNLGFVSEHYGALGGGAERDRGGTGA